MQSERQKLLGTPTLLVGPPGCGKTVWARRAASDISIAPFAPYLSEVEYIRRCAGLADRSDNSCSPPFRAPHHSVSEAGITGVLRKGWRWHPGELSLAHGGVLFLDEVFEFRPLVVEAVARAWRAGRVELTSELTQGGGTRWFPAECRVIASINLCPCGFAGGKKDANYVCRCTPAMLQRHSRRLDWLLGLFPGIERVDLRAGNESGMTKFPFSCRERHLKGK